MKKINSSGFKISNTDHKALNHYLIVSPNQWAKDALRGMISKSIKTILTDYLEKYKSIQTGNISAELSVLIPAIISMPEFKPYKVETPEKMNVERKQPQSIEIWENGFDIEDYEHAALNAYYDNPEEMLEWFMENKIYQRKKALVKEAESIMLKDPNIKEIPSKHDDMIDLITSKTDYKNRAALDAEIKQGMNL